METTLVSNISGSDFLHTLGERIKNFQDKGYEVEIQYCESYHALILAYEVK